MIGGTGSGTGGGQFIVTDFTGTSIVTVEGGFQKWRYTGVSAQTLTSIDWTLVLDGMMLVILALDDTNTLTVNTNDVSNGWVLNGSWVGYRGKSLTLQWDATTQRGFEIART
ncbi:MAG: hypothetical protein HC888_13885 [Candidatus Competibacteraceae bacterium]|nr:hypothetical protein [Candidatus Competibacteraceae bacterium]